MAIITPHLADLDKNNDVPVYQFGYFGPALSVQNLNFDIRRNKGWPILANCTSLFGPRTRSSWQLQIMTKTPCYPNFSFQNCNFAVVIGVSPNRLTELGDISNITVSRYCLPIWQLFFVVVFLFCICVSKASYSSISEEMRNQVSIDIIYLHSRLGWWTT
jgi:hypothetical protein